MVFTWKDFFSLFNPTVISEWCALIAAILLLNRKATIWRLFIFIFIITILSETFGWILVHKLEGRGNGWVFNINLIISDVFFIWIFTYAEPLMRIKKILIISILGFMVYAFVNYLFFQGFGVYQTYTDVFGDLIFILITCYFFYSVLTEDIYRNLFRYEYFWIANGFLFNALGSVVLYIFYNQINSFDDKTGVDLYGYINYVFNILLYGSLIISFICRNKNTKSSLV